MYKRFGGVDVLSMGRIPRATPGPLSVLVRPVAVSLNPVDVQIREGLERKYLTPVSPPFRESMSPAWSWNWERIRRSSPSTTPSSDTR